MSYSANPDDRQPDSMYEYALTQIVGNYITDDEGNIICYGNMSRTYELMNRSGTILSIVRTN